jgi:hypothetical protein
MLRAIAYSCGNLAFLVNIGRWLRIIHLKVDDDEKA